MKKNISGILKGSLMGMGAVLSLSTCNDKIENKKERPNVILILTDDQGYGDFSCHGNPILKTPELDKLHAQSVRLTDFHSSPMSAPTRGQLITGVDAMDNGCTAVCMGRSMVREDLPTMADIFKASGYQTAHYGKWHIGDSYPYRPEDRGFEETVSHGAWGITSIADYYGNTYWKGKFNHNGKYEDYEGYCTDVWFDYTMNYIKDWKKGDKPFFIYLATNCPHYPHLCDDKFFDPYLKAGMDTVVAKFFGQIANIDENMGRLLKMLDEKKLADNTILIYMTDNGTVRGEKVYNAGMRGKKTYPFEGGHRVPLFVRWPEGNIGEPRDIDVLTQCQDILPTLIDWCGLKKPENADFDGASLAPLFKGNAKDIDDRILVVEYTNPWNADNSLAVMWRKWRLVRGRELYDLTKDPRQENDISNERQDIVKKLQGHYKKWKKEAMKGYNQTRFIHIGTEHQNPLMLYSNDWQGSYADNYGNLYAGNKIGFWYVKVEKTGIYEFTLSRWHPVSKISLADSIKQENGNYRGGIPIAQARLKIGDFDKTVKISQDQTEVKFRIELPVGKYKIETWFLDEKGRELCSAYYTNAELLD